MVCSSLHTNTIYLSLSCSLCCTLFKSMELCLCCPWLKSLPQLSLSLLLLLLLLLYVLFFSSVHIGGPQNAVCSPAGYLFINVTYCRWICWCINFGICCVYFMLRHRCVCRQQVYMCVCTVQTQKPATHRDRFIPHTGSKCAIIFMYHIYQHIEHTYTDTEIHAYCTGSKMCHD